MPQILIKQNKRDTFLDLSKQNLDDESFLDEFSAFTSDVSQFLAGTSVSLILPEPKLDEDSKAHDLSSVIKKLQKQLNKHNISLKASFAANNLEDIVGDKILESEQGQPKQEESKAAESLPETLYVRANLRAGQMIKYPGNVFVFGDVNPSAEIIASGDVIVWGTVRGIVHAGAEGDERAIVSALKFDCGQLRISDKLCLVSHLKGKDKTSSKNKSLHPELAKIENDEIIITDVQR
jgi:septum site-determining protein MinC